MPIDLDVRAPFYTDSESVAFFRVWNLHAVNRRVVGSKSHRRSQPSVGAKTTRFSCAVPRSVCDPLTRTTMYQYQFTVPAVLSKLLHLRFGGDSIPVSHPKRTFHRFSSQLFSRYQTKSQAGRWPWSFRAKLWETISLR